MSLHTGDLRAFLWPILVAAASFAMAACGGPTETATPSPKPITGYGVIIVENAVLRSGPGVKFDQVATLNRGEPVTLLAQSPENDWYLIESAKHQDSAWILADFIVLVTPMPVPDTVTLELPRDTSEPPTGAPESPIDTSTSVVTVKASLTMPPAPTQCEPVVTALQNLNVRNGPGMQYDRVGFLLHNDSARIIGKKEGYTWWKIQCPEKAIGDECWVTGGDQYSFAQCTDAVAFVPVPTPLAEEFILLKPTLLDGTSFGPTEFVWQWNGPIGADRGFEVRVWREGEPPAGVHNAMEDNRNGRVVALDNNTYRLRVNIRDAPGIRRRSGEYLWTVLLVQVSPYYKDLGIQATPGRLRFGVPSAEDGDDGGPPRPEPPIDTPCPVYVCTQLEHMPSYLELAATGGWLVLGLFLGLVGLALVKTR